MNKWKLKALKSLKWITIDKDGCVFAHTKKPKIQHYGCWKTNKDYDLDEYFDCVYLGQEEDEYLVKNWKKSLTKLERKL